MEPSTTNNPLDNPSNGAAAIILTHDGKILLQARDDYPAIGRFGGGCHPGDKDFKATLLRELKEELGAEAMAEDLVFLTQKVGVNLNGSSGLTVTFFWHDKKGSIKGCYEGAPAYFDSAAAVQANTKVREHTKECVQIAASLGLVA